MNPLLRSLFIPLLVASCSVLEPVRDTSIHHLLDPTIPERSITGFSPAVAIARPSLPSYLDRQQLVMRTAGGELKMNPYHLWAEPLDAAISRVTAVNLSRLTNSLNVQPIENFITLDYQSLLEIRISRFERDPSGRIILACTWKLQPVSGNLTNPRPFSTSVPILNPVPMTSADPQSGQTAAMNEALARLARQIARAL